MSQATGNEGPLKKRIVDALNQIPGVMAWTSNATGAGGIRVKGGFMQLAPAGSPDILCFVKAPSGVGTCVGFEIKRPKSKGTTAGEVSKTQEDFRPRWEALGLRYVVVDNLDAALAAVRAAMEGR